MVETDHRLQNRAWSVMSKHSQGDHARVQSGPISGLYVSFVVGLSGDTAYGDVDLRVLLIPALAVYTVATLRTPLVPGASRIPSLVLGSWSALLAWCIAVAVADPQGVNMAVVGDLISMLVLTSAFTVFARRANFGQFLRFFRLVVVTGLAALGIAAVVGGVGVGQRLSLPGGGPNILGRILGFGLVSSILLYQHTRRAWYGVVGGAFIFGVLASGSRGAMLAALASALFVVAPSARIDARSVLKLLAIVSIPVLVLLRAAGSGTRAWLGNRFWVLTVDERYLAGRDGLAQRAIDVFQLEPFTGAGFGAVESSPGLGSGLHAHNILLTALSEAGLIGAALLVVSALLPLAAIASRRYFMRNSVSRTFFALALSVLIGSMFSGYIYDFRFFFCFCAAALCSTSLDQVSRAPLPPTSVGRQPVPILRERGLAGGPA